MTSSEPNTRDRAEKALATLQVAVHDLWASEDDDDHDAAWGVTREALDWVLDIEGHIDGSYGGYLVVLDRRLKDQDADALLRLLLHIDGVIAVSPVPEDVPTYFATARLQARLRDAMSEALDGFRWHEKTEE